MIGWYIAVILYMLGAYVAVADAQELMKGTKKPQRIVDSTWIILAIFWPLIAFLVMAEEAYKSMREE